MKFPTKIYLGGDLTIGQGTLDVYNPAGEAQIATVAAARLGDVQRALERAQDAFPSWSNPSIFERQSGIGHDCSYLALHDYLVLKRITRSMERSAA